MKVIFLLSGKIGGLFIRQVCKITEIEIVACVTENAKNIIKVLPEIHMINFKYNDYYFFNTFQFDCVISYNWNYRIPEEICEKYNCYNFHQSLLPKHRGPIPLVFSILQNELETGVTLHRIRKEFDKGEIYAQEKVAITKDATYISLNLRCLKAAIVLLKKFAYEYPNIVCTEQTDIFSSYESFKELNRYIITKETSLKEFNQIVKAFDGIIPLLYFNGDSVNQIVKFSYEFDDPRYIEFILKDASIYIIREKWDESKYDRLLSKFVKRGLN